jgi:hypothetical protein
MRNKKQDLLATRFMRVSCFANLSTLEDAGDMFLRNVGSLSTGYTALYPKRPALVSTQFPAMGVKLTTHPLLVPR